MADAIHVRHDEQFVCDVMGKGGADVQKCYQCATCSAVCELSPDDSPFPRKQMLLTQWGMKEKVLGDPSIWLCHNCGDCTTYCPRGAKPGEVFGALRNQAIQFFAFPRFVGKLVASPKLWPLLFAFCGIILGIIAVAAPKEEVSNRLIFGNLFAPHVLEYLFFTISGLVTIAFLAGFLKFLKATRASGADGNLFAGLIPAIVEIMAHTRFGKCKAERLRHWGHFLTLWGFAGLAFMGTVVGIGTMVGLMHTPLPFWDPAMPVESVLKIFANVSAVVILIGLIMLLIARYGNTEKKASSTYFDWFFLWTLTGIVATGILSEFLRLSQIKWVMFPTYFVHLILVMALFIFAPYTKFAHLVYRTLAMAVARGKK